MSKRWGNHQNRYILWALIVLFGNSCVMLVPQGKLVSSPESEPVAQAEQPITRGQVLPITAQALIKEEIINLEVAQTPQQQALGLMFRDTLPDDRGMFFPFEQARIARFWMNNVPVALDLIFIKEERVIAIAHAAPPCKTKPEDCPLYGPNIVVDGVIELRAGRARELGLATGDMIDIKYLDILQQN